MHVYGEEVEKFATKVYPGGVSAAVGGGHKYNDKSGDPRGDVIFGTRVRQLTAPRAAPSPERMSSKHPPPGDSDDRTT